MKKYRLEKKHLKERLVELRKVLGLSQAKFASKINRSPGLISLVETGRTFLGEDTLQAICSIYSVNPQWLYTGEGEMLTLERPEIKKTGLGHRIRQVRAELGLSRDQFAKGAGCTGQYVYYVENEKKTASDKLLRKIASAYDVNYEWLLNGEGKMFMIVSGEVDDRLIRWLREHPKVVIELKNRNDYY